MATHGKSRKPPAAAPFPTWREAVSGRLGEKPGTRITRPYEAADIHIPLPDMRPRTGSWLPKVDAQGVRPSHSTELPTPLNIEDMTRLLAALRTLRGRPS